MNLVALSLASALFLQAPPPSSQRVAVILVPMDHGAESSTLRLETFITEALEGMPQLVVKSTDQLGDGRRTVHGQVHSEHVA